MKARLLAAVLAMSMHGHATSVVYAQEQEAHTPSQALRYENLLRQIEELLVRQGELEARNAKLPSEHPQFMSNKRIRAWYLVSDTQKITLLRGNKEDSHERYWNLVQKLVLPEDRAIFTTFVTTNDIPASGWVTLGAVVRTSVLDRKYGLLLNTGMFNKWAKTPHMAEAYAAQVIIHEYGGHVLAGSLLDKHSAEGCLVKADTDSHPVSTRFTDVFWTRCDSENKRAKSRKDFVSEYAAIKSDEDFSESVVAYVVCTLPSKEKAKTVRAQKRLFLHDAELWRSYRAHVHTVLSARQLNLVRQMGKIACD